MTDIDILTTTYRNKDKLKKCLSGVVEKTKFVDYKWYVMANDPDEEVKQIIHDSMYVDGILFNDKIEPVFNPDNSGSFSSNNNKIAKYGDGKYLLFLNDDTEPINDSWLLAMKRILDNDEKVGAVGSLLLFPDKSVQHGGVIFSSKTNNLPYHFCYKKPINNMVLSNRYFQAVTAACMLVRRKDFEQLGGFDEEFKFGYEDTKFCLEIKSKLKKNIVYCASSCLWHYEGVSGRFLDHENLQHNIKVFRKKCEGLYYNDLEFYLSNPNFMLYNR